jgi:hypothetical protein
MSYRERREQFSHISSLSLLSQIHQDGAVRDTLCGAGSHISETDGARVSLVTAGVAVGIFQADHVAMRSGPLCLQQFGIPILQGFPRWDIG